MHFPAHNVHVYVNGIAFIMMQIGRQNVYF